MRRKRYMWTLVLAMFLFVSIAYAVLNSGIDINGTTSIKANSWNVHFENIKVTAESVSANTTPISDNATTTELTYNVSLNKPGDFYEFYVDVANGGTIDAMLEDNATITGIDSNISDVIVYSIHYENGRNFSKYDKLSSGEKRTLKVKVEYKKDITNNQLVSEGKNLQLNFAINYIQADNNAVEFNSDSWKDNDDNGVISLNDELCYGTECFMVYENNNGHVKALAKYNLLVGSNCNLVDGSYTDCTLIDTNIPGYGLQNAAYKGYTGSGDQRDPVAYGTVMFSNEAYWYEDWQVEAPKAIYGDAYPTEVLDSNSNLYSILNSYNGTLNNLGLNANVRLLSDSEAKALGCRYDDQAAGCDSSVYPWIYSSTYWTSTAIGNWNVMIVMANSGYGNNYYKNNNAGVRPVIEFDL